MRHLVLISLFVISLAFIPSSSSACSCVSIGDGPPAVETYDSIFEGTVISTQVILAGESEDFNRVVAFQVQRVWKGPRSAVLGVYTGLGGPDCGFVFEIGREYLVFAGKAAPVDRELFGRQDQTLVVSSCSHTASSESADETRAYLDKARKSWSPTWREFNETLE